MFNKIPLNPFEGDNEYNEKIPEDMTLSELRMLLHIQRQNLKLDVEKISSKINYSKAILDILDEFGLTKKLESFISRPESE